MNILDLIEKKKNKQTLQREEIEFIVSGYTSGIIPDYQMSAWLMAVCLCGMDREEIFCLTNAMAKSGEFLDLSHIGGIKADKHSSGGVGDKTTPIVASIVSACGVKMAKMSGRGLGHTGGTIDKLESICGFRTDFSMTDITQITNDIGCYLGGQTAKLAPADKRIYALRDVTATVNSIPLIASSIMSKKIASGSDVLVLDVKVGSGAFMKSVDDARELAKIMTQIGHDAGINTTAVVTDMNEPLGYAVGNALEIQEVISILKNSHEQDNLVQLCIILSAHILLLSGKASSYEDGYKQAKEILAAKKAYDQFVKIVKMQGGDIKILDDVSLFGKPKYKRDIVSSVSGYVNTIDCEKIGHASVVCGAGRLKKDDVIDICSGLIIHKKCGDYVQSGEKLVTVYTEKENMIDEVTKQILSAYEISDKQTTKNPTIYETVTHDN